jgi:hypothetical protein
MVAVPPDPVPTSQLIVFPTRKIGVAKFKLMGKKNTVIISNWTSYPH